MDATGVPGRDDLVQRGHDALVDGRSLLLRGEPGVGTSRVADGIVEAVRATHHVVTLRAAPGAREIPFAPLLATVDAGADLEPVERTSLFARLRAAIGHQAGPKTVVYHVDDIDLLDDASLVFVHQSVLNDDARLLATLHLGRPAPPAVADLTRRGDLDQLDVHPFDHDTAGRVADAIAGVALDDTTKHRLWESCRGNALFITEVLTAARARGLLDGPAPVVVDPLPIRAPHLVAVVEDRLGLLDDADRRALTHLAFAEPCGPAELASVADTNRLADLERRGLVRVTTAGARLRLHLAHPLYGEVIRAATGALERRSVMATLAHDLLATGARRRSDLIPLGRFAVDGGVDVEPDLLAQATSLAYHAGDIALGERLGRRTFERTGEFSAGWDALHCLLLLGRLDGARELLGVWGAHPDRPAATLAVAAGEAKVEFWLNRDEKAAHLAIDRALDAVTTDPDDELVPTLTRAELMAVRGVMLSAAGRHRDTVATVTPLLDRGAPQTRIRAAYAAAHSLRALGRPAAALAVLDEADSLYADIGVQSISLSPRFLQWERSLVLTHLGRLDDARCAAEAIRTDATSEVFHALSFLAVALVDGMAGRPHTSLAGLEHVHALTSDRDRFGMPTRWILATEALIRTSTDDQAGAAAVLERLDADDHPARTFDVMGAIARARLLAARQFPEQARDLLRAEMARHRERGAVYDEVATGLELVRSGRAGEVADRLGELARHAEGPLYRLLAAEARGVAGDDHQALGATADELAELGYAGLATETAMRAGHAAMARHDERAATRWRRRAAQLRERCEGVGDVEPGLADAMITAREREIAQMAAYGLSSKQIASRLFISARTVDNHLAKVYRKLGVRTRAELAEALRPAIRTG